MLEKLLINGQKSIFLDSEKQKVIVLSMVLQPCEFQLEMKLLYECNDVHC